MPVVTYKLWPETLELLEAERSSDPELLLVSEKGTPLWRSTISASGRVWWLDLVKQLWRKQKTGLPLKAFRSVSATLLDGHTARLPSGELHNPYAGCSTLFLGHAPATIKDRHYARPLQELFEDALAWLRKQYLGVSAFTES